MLRTYYVKKAHYTSYHYNTSFLFLTWRCKKKKKNSAVNQQNFPRLFNVTRQTCCHRPTLSLKANTAFVVIPSPQGPAGLPTSGLFLVYLVSIYGVLNVSQSLFQLFTCIISLNSCNNPTRKVLFL